MAEMISIGTSSHVEEIKSRLESEFNMLANDGMKIGYEETPAGDYTFLGYKISDYGTTGYSEEDTRLIFKHYLANVVADVIVNHWEKHLINQIIRDNYTQLDDDERKNIFSGAIRYLNHGAERPEDTAIYQISRKSKILHKVLEYLRANSKIVVEGFIRFRLKDYIDELQEAVAKSVDDYMMDKEYKEFIRLLKYFVDIQEPRFDEVHVVLKATGAFKLFDGQGTNISNDYLENFIFDLSDNQINQEDILISALITIAPLKVVLHLPQQITITSLETVDSVFGDRVSRCAGCDLCR